MEQIKDFNTYKTTYQKSIENPEAFWAEISEEFLWYKKWDKVLNWNFETPEINWFDGGTTNICTNAIDKNLEKFGDRTAIIWEPNSPDEAAKKFTYRELHQAVCQCANALLSLGIAKGDRVCIYMPMVPEGAIAMLACARIGAIHSTVFAGFAVESLRDRINDSECKLLITADAFHRGEKTVELKTIADEALKQTPSIQHCLVFNRTNTPINFVQGRDIWWHDLVPQQATTHEPEQMEAEAPLFILYTSGSTGKPKGVVHTTAGYMVFMAYTFKQVFNYRDGEVFFCTADIGWITGHSYTIYGPLLNGGTTLMFEGVPTYPDHGRFWDIVDKHKVNILYTAPTAIRTLEMFGTDIFKAKNLSSLRVLGSVGEPINEEAWHWYFENAGKKNCPIVDTWWQTETGGILISPIATVTPLKPAFATLPLPGVQPILVDENGKEVVGNPAEGRLCMKFPWPGMARTLYGNHERYKQTYFSTYPNLYFSGDGAKRDENGYYRITGRVDDVINVSGHRIGTGEVEEAINSNDLVVESAVVGFPHDIKGQGLYAFVICNSDVIDTETLVKEIKHTVNERIGAFARPDKIQIVPGLPKTRSGKIMRRILRKIAEGDTSNLGDISTLIDPSVVETILKSAV
ncbi:MAG: acetate--CoA ligase [Chitinophagales bacterium]|nr:acetate--CoA ligase [Chitinophagales bacterium]HRN93868.1 acetate--CoA ligase [Chitinophagales bacterium]HRP39589.1 acetate--CoA ligase [Chitinophagales bacterium]